VFDEERTALHRRLGRARGDRVLSLVITLDASERAKSVGRGPSEPPPRGNPADIKAELRRVLELSDEELIRLAGIAEDAIQKMDRAYPRPGNNSRAVSGASSARIGRPSIR
jgi:hypothetical protein